MSTDRSLVEWEVYPGATNDIDRLAEESGGWVCEQHPDLEWPHGDCEGPGMLASDVQAA
jgi:hypothetical protein